MWIRIESYQPGGKPDGVYQHFGYYYLNDFCGRVMLLPVPEDWVEDPDGGQVHFWFTEQGFLEYGKDFSGIFGMEALEVEPDPCIYITVIDNPEDYHPYYQDDF